MVDRCRGEHERHSERHQDVPGVPDPPLTVGVAHVKHVNHDDRDEHERPDHRQPSGGCWSCHARRSSTFPDRRRGSAAVAHAHVHAAHDGANVSRAINRQGSPLLPQPSRVRVSPPRRPLTVPVSISRAMGGLGSLLRWRGRLLWRLALIVALIALTGARSQRSDRVAAERGDDGASRPRAGGRDARPPLSRRGRHRTAACPSRKAAESRDADACRAPASARASGARWASDRGGNGGRAPPLALVACR